MTNIFLAKYLAAKVMGITLLYLTGVVLAKKFSNFHEEEAK